MILKNMEWMPNIEINILNNYIKIRQKILPESFTNYPV